MRQYSSTAVDVARPSGALRAIVVVVALVAAAIMWSGAPSPAGAEDDPEWLSIVPCAVVDTRPAPSTVGSRSTPIEPYETYTVTVGPGDCAIPPDAREVMLNVAAVDPRATVALTVFPAGERRPTAPTFLWRYPPYVDPQFGSPPSAFRYVHDLARGTGISFHNAGAAVDLRVTVEAYLAPVARLAPGALTPVSTGTTGSAVVANLALVDASREGYVTAAPCAALVPGPQATSNGNAVPVRAVSNLALVPLDAGGGFCVYNQFGVNVVVDVQGSFAPAAAGGQSFTVMTPRRLLDTRREPEQPLTSPTPVSAGTITPVHTGVPAGATAVLVNLTMVDGWSSGFVTADRCPTLAAASATTSSGNHGASEAVANLAVVPVDAEGTFCIFNQRPVHLVVDLQGVFAPASTPGLELAPMPTTRVLDTRVAPRTTPFADSITRVETGVAGGTRAVLVNLTMVPVPTMTAQDRQPGYITADRCSTMRPGTQSTSSGNHGYRLAVANLAVVPVDDDGSFCIYQQRTVDLVVDVQGAFREDGTHVFFPESPRRVLDTRAPLALGRI